MAHDPSSHTSVIRSVTIRVAGQLATEAFAHHFGTPSQQVGVRAGDSLSYVTTKHAATAIARSFTDSRALAERQQLSAVVPLTWLGIEPGTYPPTLLTHYGTTPACRVGYQPRREISGQIVPAHVWVRVGPVLWQICDLAAARRLAEVWTRCARLLDGRAPTHQPVRSTASVPQGSDVSPSADEPEADQAPDADAPAAPQPPSPPTTTTAETVGADGKAAAAGTLAADSRSDSELLAAYVDTGSRTALAALVARHHQKMIAAARRVLGPRGEIEDVAQSAWVSVVVKAASYRGEASVATWLYRIAHRQAIDVLRRERGHRADLSAEPDQAADGSVGRPVAAESSATEKADTSIVLEELMATLPAAQREAIELVDLQGLSLAEAAARLSVAEGTLKSRRTRGRIAMNAAAARRGLDPSF
jgi:RNA polymerase sigma-70 factor, ECF subfamily